MERIETFERGKMDGVSTAVKIILAHIQGLLDESETSQPCYYKVVYRDTLEDVRDWIADYFRTSIAKMKEVDQL